MDYRATINAGQTGRSTEILFDSGTTTFEEYVFSSTIRHPVPATADLVTLRYNNNNGSYYMYTKVVYSSPGSIASNID